MSASTSISLLFATAIEAARQAVENDIYSSVSSLAAALSPPCGNSRPR
jgi:hypothetical protein